VGLRFTFHQAGLAHVGHLAKGLWVMVIRIGTWNLENLFKPPDPFAPKTEQEYHAKLDALASAITRMDPHVLAVQEAASGSRATTASRRGLVVAFQAAWMGYSALVWGQRLAASAPLTRRTPGAALTLRTQHSSGSPPIIPACAEEGSGRLSAIGGNGRIGF